MNTLEHLGISILLGNLVAVLISGGLAIFVVLYASHKIAGPLYRFEKLCEQIGDGQLETVTSLREHDQLQELGAAFAGMVAKLRTRKAQRDKAVTELTGHLDQLQQDPAISTQFSGCLEQMRQALLQLKE